MSEYKVNKPNKALNSDIFASENPGCSLYTIGDNLFISGATSQKNAEDLLAAHNPKATAEPTITEKLASVGLSVDDLKLALGL